MIKLHRKKLRKWNKKISWKVYWKKWLVSSKYFFHIWVWSCIFQNFLPTVEIQSHITNVYSNLKSSPSQIFFCEIGIPFKYILDDVLKKKLSEILFDEFLLKILFIILDPTIIRKMKLCQFSKFLLYKSWILKGGRPPGPTPLIILTF